MLRILSTKSAVRREFTALFWGAAWPLTARAQQRERVLGGWDENADENREAGHL
jgi:hypothetical protein